jgi:hypothetical protein
MRYFLAGGTDVAALRSGMVEAVRRNGDFIDFTEVGNRAVSVLLSPGVDVILETSEVAEDARDDGDLSAPYEAPEGARRITDWDWEYPVV